MTIGLKRKQKITLSQFAILAALVVVLEYAARSGSVGAITLSAPSEMVITLFDLTVSGSITEDIIATAGSTFIAFFLATVIGIPVGWALWNWGTLQSVLDPYLVALYAMPTFAFYPLLIAIFGLNKIPIVLISFVLSIIAIIINTANGFGQVKDVYEDVGRSLTLTEFEILRYIQFPAAVPYIFTGLKLGFIYALIGVIASEFILAESGLGFLVAYHYNNFSTKEMYAVMLFVVLIAVVMNTLLLRIENRLYQRSVTN